MHSDSGPGVARLAAAPNFRDLGGMKAAHGARIAHGKLFRSEAIVAPRAEDEAVLASYGIRVVCDLRGEPERASAPNDWWRARGAAVLAMDITADIRGTAHWEAMRNDPGEAGAVALMRLTYRALPEAAATHLRRVFACIENGELPLIIHCTAGKDRTGVVVALLLSALGVPREEIYADYLASGLYQSPLVIERTREIMRAGLGRDVKSAALRAICGVRQDYLDASFAVIEEAHGSVETYLTEFAGLDEPRRERVRARLLADEEARRSLLF